MPGPRSSTAEYYVQTRNKAIIPKEKKQNMRVKSGRTRKTFYAVDLTRLKNSWERRTVV